MTDKLKTIEDIYAAFGRGDVAAILSRLSDDVVWEHDAADHDIPWLAPRRGRAEIGGFFAALGALEVLRFQPRRMLADGDLAVAVIDVELKHRATGRIIRDLELHLWSFDRDGRISCFRHVADTHQHWLAMQP